MSIIDEILTENANKIEDYLANTSDVNREMMSVEMLPILRSLCEYSMYKIYDVENHKDLYTTQDNLKIVRKYIKDKYKNIYDFHCQLDAGPGHGYVSKKNAESLILKYIPSLFELRDVLNEVCSISILSSLNKYPLDLDESLMDFYSKIYDAIMDAQDVDLKKSRNSYFVRKKSFKCVNNKCFYEYVMDAADDKNNKFNTFVVYSLKNIKFCYDLKIYLTKREIVFLDTKITINIINDYEYSIRPCCFDNLLCLINYNKVSPTRNDKYNKIMSLIKSDSVSLYEIVTNEKYLFDDSKDFYYCFIKKCRDFLYKEKVGANLIKLLLCTMKNDFINAQLAYNKVPNTYFNGLPIRQGSFAYEVMPYAFYPRKIKVGREILNRIIEKSENVEAEIFYSSIVNYMDENSVLFVSSDDIGYEEDRANELMKLFNRELFEKTPYYNNHEIIFVNNHYTIKFYYDETVYILDLIGNTKKSQILLNYSSNQNLTSIQKTIVEKGFDNSNIIFVCGSAGTGKTTVIKEILRNNTQLRVLCLTTTNTALNNLKIDLKNVTYLNIAKFIKNLKKSHNEYDLIIIDEASFVSTDDAFNIIKKYVDKNILIVGDTEQIQSIEFGNWFKLAVKKYQNKNFVYVLDKDFRSDSDALPRLWKNVRDDHSDKLLELLSSFNMSSKLTNDVFKINDNEVVLCLNYDGLYGINNVNRYLQAKNPNDGYLYQQNFYKVGDPVVFIVNDFDDWGVYNNLTGKIVDIKDSEEEIEFYIEINKELVKKLFMPRDVTIIRVDKPSLVRINKYKTYSDDADVDVKTKLPFQIAYAMSIHKAQGLEFEKVKIIITKESDEQITKNIFYTAITRAKKKLMIYWQPEVAKEISENLKNDEDKCSKDLSLLNQSLKTHV